MFAQVVTDHTVNAWEVLLALVVAMPGTIAVILTFLQNTQIQAVKSTSQQTSEKVDAVGNQLNGHLAAQQKQADDHHAEALKHQKEIFDAALKLAAERAEADAVGRTTTLDKRIATLENLIAREPGPPSVAPEPTTPSPLEVKLSENTAVTAANTAKMPNPLPPPPLGEPDPDLSGIRRS